MLLRKHLTADHLRRLSDDAAEIARQIADGHPPEHVNTARAHLLQRDAARFAEWADLIDADGPPRSASSLNSTPGETMSYSFSLRAASVAALIAQAESKLEDVVTTQPAHKSDKAAALGTLRLHAAAVGEPPDGKELAGSMSGRCALRTDPAATHGQLLHATTTVSVYVSDQQ